VLKHLSLLWEFVVIAVLGSLVRAHEALVSWRERTRLSIELWSLHREARRAMDQARAAMSALAAASADCSCSSRENLRRTSRRAEIDLLRALCALQRTAARVESARQLADDCLSIGFAGRCLRLTRKVVDVRDFAAEASRDLKTWQARFEELQTPIIEAVAAMRFAYLE